MLFHRERPKKLTQEDFLKQLREAGFQTTPTLQGRVMVTRNGIGTLIEEGSEHPKVVARAGVLIGNEIGALVDGGFQKFFQTPGGHRKPALASDLKAIHAFEEDLREALGLVSLYNEALGSVSRLYLYDRVKDRDSGHAKKPWELQMKGTSREPHL